MTSNNLTTRTYTTPTCTLNIQKSKQLARDLDGRSKVVNFKLNIDHPDGASERVSLHGDPSQLEYLHEIVNKYIVDLVAKFPLPTAPESKPAVIDRSPSPEPVAAETTDTNQSFSAEVEPSTLSGLLQNLPGLRTKSPPAPTVDEDPASGQLSTKNISKLLNRRQQDPAIRRSASQHDQNPPSLTGGDRSLDHTLHLGNLATNTSGSALTLSAIQLFDLAAVLDEYATEWLKPIKQDASSKLFGEISGLGGGKQTDLDPNPTPLSQLPNLTKIPTVQQEDEPSQVYYRTRKRSRPAFMSAIPWATAAAVIIGGPLLLFGNSNSLKSSLGKFKSNLQSSDLASKQPSATAGLPRQQPDNPGTQPTTGLPKPWQAQPVQPPVNTPAQNIGSQTPQNPSKIGIAPLPSEIVSKTEPNLTKVSPGKSEIAPNPLNTAGLNPGGSKLPTAITTPTTPQVAPKTTPAKPGKPAPKSDEMGKISISNQPILMPQDLPATTKLSPFAPPNSLPPTERVTPAPFNPAASKKPAAKPKVKPPAVTANKPQPKTPFATVPFRNPAATLEPKSTKLNPNLVGNPESMVPTNGAISEPQNPRQLPQVVPDRPLQTKTSSADPGENPSLQETKRYFQGKWKADPAQTNSLQYVLEVSGKSGLVRSVDPQGEAATNYLKQTKLIKTGQKLVSPVAGSSNQKIRVLLQPDGNVDTFIEP